MSPKSSTPAMKAMKAMKDAAGRPTTTLSAVAEWINTADDDTLVVKRPVAAPTVGVLKRPAAAKAAVGPTAGLCVLR